MTFVPGVELALLFQAALLGGVATAILAVGALLAPPDWVDAPGAATRWAEETLPVVHDVKQTLDVDESVPYDRLQRRLLPLSSRLDRHAEIAPPTVDDHLVVAVTELGYGCRAVGMELTRADRLEWDAPGSEVEAGRAVADDLLAELDSLDSLDSAE